MPLPLLHWGEGFIHKGFFQVGPLAFFYVHAYCQGRTFVYCVLGWGYVFLDPWDIHESKLSGMGFFCHLVVYFCCCVLSVCWKKEIPLKKELKNQCECSAKAVWEWTRMRWPACVVCFCRCDRNTWHTLVCCYRDFFNFFYRYVRSVWQWVVLLQGWYFFSSDIWEVYSIELHVVTGIFFQIHIWEIYYFELSCNRGCFFSRHMRSAWQQVVLLHGMLLQMNE